ncbi:hypothetical protein HYH03_000105 [Edaphochlamys debaryana]|uniref:TraB domain-containing protein n=1 Tax=Edaphochlamys debaryana TaxID=47281 RepID=A0A835YEY8_9CHLO|nr:hypothetical protein HYH03_000105 [Edaphochlamys debaryana]|eukprot:KAG2501600.1 hypothetical protein HYH03_000105 [Edaphochlamys debaryana]
MVPLKASSTPVTAPTLEDAPFDAELQRVLLAGPPDDWDWRSETRDVSRRWVEAHAPELADLVEEGTLIVVPRRPDYAERRSDGYTEPRAVLLVGTAHVSRRSQLDVARVIRAVRPDSVVVELCKSRSAALAAPIDLSPLGPPTSATLAPATQSAPAAAAGSSYESDSEAAGPSAASPSPSPSSPSSASTPPMDSTSPPGTGGGGAGGAGASPRISAMNLAGGEKGGFLGAVARSVALGGQSSLLLRVLMAGLASRTAGSLGVSGGGEFAAAQVAAEEVRRRTGRVGAQVVLGDRPVEITLSRVWAALPLLRRLALCSDLLGGAVGAQQQALSEALVERLKQDDAVGALFKQLSERYPELVAPLVVERDLYLAWSCKRSKAVNGAETVVGVMGRGHLRGVVFALLRDQGGAGLR